MNYEDIAKKLGLDAVEKAVMDMLIPFIEEKVKGSDPVWDDLLWEKVKPAVLEFVDKINGAKDLAE